MLRKVSRKKPILMLKSSRGELGSQASASHTASLTANDSVVEALMKQSGAIRCDSWTDFLNIGWSLLRQPLPRGRNIAIVTNAGEY
jgi:acetate---CoA ligase (ADP-forming)